MSFHKCIYKEKLKKIINESILQKGTNNITKEKMQNYKSPISSKKWAIYVISELLRTQKESFLLFSENSS